MEKSNPNGPAEELRAAATMLRETASKATRGRPLPWRIVASFKEWLIGSTDQEHLVTSTGDKAVAEWIRLMSPAVAELLAAWLYATAAEMDEHLAFEGPASKSVHPRIVLGLGAPRADWTAALAFARTILGMSSHGSEAGR